MSNENNGRINVVTLVNGDIEGMLRPEGFMFNIPENEVSEKWNSNEASGDYMIDFQDVLNILSAVVGEIHSGRLMETGMYNSLVEYVLNIILPGKLSNDVVPLVMAMLVAGPPTEETDIPGTEGEKGCLH